MSKLESGGTRFYRSVTLLSVAVSVLVILWIALASIMVGFDDWRFDLFFLAAICSSCGLVVGYKHSESNSVVFPIVTIASSCLIPIYYSVFSIRSRAFQFDLRILFFVFVNALQIVLSTHKLLSLRRNEVTPWQP
jgi:hypothetical protein